VRPPYPGREQTACSSKVLLLLIEPFSFGERCPFEIEVPHEMLMLLHLSLLFGK